MLVLVLEYHDEAILARFVQWLRDQVTRGIDAASGSPPLATFAAMVILVALVVALGWLLSRARLTSRAQRSTGAALTDDGLTAAELRARALEALADGRPGDALVDAFRALALRQVENGRIDDQPGATAHELAAGLGTAFPPLARRIAAAADTFDLVLYGGRPATPDQARDLLGLDDALVGAR
jgi:hypothetical protein